MDPYVSNSCIRPVKRHVEHTEALLDYVDDFKHVEHFVLSMWLAPEWQKEVVRLRDRLKTIKR